MRQGSYKWWLLLLLGGAYFFHQADRAIFGVLTPYIQQDLGLDKLQIGHITTVLFVTIAIATFFAGFIGDRFNRKWVITLSLLFWSVATAAIGLVRDFQIGSVVVSAFAATLFLRSIAVGGGESFYAPSAMSLLASYHKQTRSLAFSIHQAALYTGLMLSGVLAAKVMGIFGSWRDVFIVFGVLGFLLGVVFIFALKEAPRVVSRNDATKVSFFESFKFYFTNPSALLATTGFIAIVCVNNAYLCWAPAIFSERFAVNPEVAGKHAMLYHHLVAFLAILLGGYLTDLFVKKTPRFRLALQITSLLLGAPALYFIGSANSFNCAVALTAVYGLFRGLFEVNTHASVFDVVPAKYHSSIVGFMILLAMLTGAFFGGELAGGVLQYFKEDGCKVLFALMASVYVLAALAMMVSFFFTFKKDRKLIEQDT
ncbi:MAG: MFS transporter [Kiritimatiellae bacterium]|nr:MFS transporter [Kiritimatiellia bacterium]